MIVDTTIDSTVDSPIDFLAMKGIVSFSFTVKEENKTSDVAWFVKCFQTLRNKGIIKMKILLHHVPLCFMETFKHWIKLFISLVKN